MEKTTIKFFASLGVISGYGHDNNVVESPEETAGKAWQEAAAKVQQATKSPSNENGTYVGAVITPARTAYHTDWGCPVGGELTVLITGECNPEYTEIVAYKTAVVEVLRQTALALGQSTTQLSFVEAEFEYLDFRPKSE